VIAPPRVVLRVPDGWRETPLAPTDLSETPGVRVLTWQAWGPEAPASAGLVAACFGADPGTWTPEVEPLVLERLRATVSSTALRLARVGQLRVVSTDRLGVVTRELLEGRGDAEHQLSAQVFLGFVDPRESGGRPTLAGCFALCTADLPACGASVTEASVAADFVPPPPPTLSVRAALAIVGHPSTSVGVALTLCILLGAMLIVTRRRPRTK
jgi:hypothetical protein